MYRGIAYQLKLRKLQKQQRKNLESYKKRLRDAENAEEDDEKIESIERDFHIDSLVDHESIELLQHKYLMDKAQRYLLPIPKFDEESGDWEESFSTGMFGWRLSLSAQEKVRLKIDEYEKHRRERIHSWMTALTGIVGACAGLVGVLIGLIAISC